MKRLPDPRPYFAEIEDPRCETRNKLHKLEDIVMIVLCAVLSDIKDWVGMEDFAYEKEVWLRGFLELPGGIPSHDTLSDVLGRINRKAFAAAFGAWVRRALPALHGRGGQHRRDGVPEEHCAPDRETGRRRCAGAERQPPAPVPRREVVAGQ